MAHRAHGSSAGPQGRRVEPAARRAPSGLLALHQGIGNRAVGSLLRQQLQRQPKKPRSYEQSITIGGIDHTTEGGPNISSGVTEELVIAAQKRLAKGALTDLKDLKDLRALALADDTISDAERLFLAALLDPVNADRVKAINLKSQEGRDLKLRFTLDDPTAKRIRDVADMGRPGAGTGDAETQIAGLAGKAGRVAAHAAALVKFANDRKVPLKDVVEAMRMAGSDSTPGDMVAAGTVYAIARAAGHPLADVVKAGTIKVDEMYLPKGERAGYMPTAKGEAQKGDTMYLRPTFDVNDLHDRETVIHELEHALQDKPESGKLVIKTGAELEPDAYVAGAKYALGEIAALTEGKQADVVKKLAKDWAPWDMFAAIIAGKTSSKLMAVAKAINTARKKDALDDSFFTKPDDELKQHLVLKLGDAASNKSGLSGFAGESAFDVYRALMK